MTVQELIDALSKLNPQAVVLIDDNSGIVSDEIDKPMSLTDYTNTFFDCDGEDDIERKEYAEDYFNAHRCDYPVEPVILSFFS